MFAIVLAPLWRSIPPCEATSSRSEVPNSSPAILAKAIGKSWRGSPSIRWFSSSGLLDAKGVVLEINQVALDAVGNDLTEVEGRPFWTTFWWQVSEEVNATLREMILRAAPGEFVRWDAEIYGRAGGKETIIIDASLCPVKDDHGNVVSSLPRAATSPKRRPMSAKSRASGRNSRNSTS